MKFNIYFKLKGPGGVIDVPNKTNPVDSEDLKSLLVLLKDALPSAMGCETIGVRIEPYEAAMVDGVELVQCDSVEFASFEDMCNLIPIRPVGTDDGELGGCQVCGNTSTVEGISKEHGQFRFCNKHKP